MEGILQYIEPLLNMTEDVSSAVRKCLSKRTATKLGRESHKLLQEMLYLSDGLTLIMVSGMSCTGD